MFNLILAPEVFPLQLLHQIHYLNVMPVTQNTVPQYCYGAQQSAMDAHRGSGIKTDQLGEAALRRNAQAQIELS